MSLLIRIKLYTLVKCFVRCQNYDSRYLHYWNLNKVRDSGYIRSGPKNIRDGFSVLDTHTPGL